MEFGSLFTETMTKLANMSFFEEFDAEPVVYDKVFATEDVTKSGGRSYGQQTEIVGETAPEEIGYRQEHKVEPIQEGWTSFWALRLFQKGFDVTQDDLDIWKGNDRMAEDYVKRRSKDIGSAMKRWRDEFCANVLNRGSITAGDRNYFFGNKPGYQVDPYPGLLYDNKSLFNSAHPLYLASGTTFSNVNTSAALTHANLVTAKNIFQVTNAKTERNYPFRNMVEAMIINPMLADTADEIIGSEKKSGTANNDKNVLRNLIDVVPWHYITNTTAWYLCRKKKGITFRHRGEPRSDTKMEKRVGRGVLSVSWWDEFTVHVDQWRYWYGAGNTLATS